MANSKILVNARTVSAPEEVADFEDRLATACIECDVPDSIYEALCIALRTTSGKGGAA